MDEVVEVEVLRANVRMGMLVTQVTREEAPGWSDCGTPRRGARLVEEE